MSRNAIATFVFLAGAAGSGTADAPVFRYDPDKIDVGTVYHYKKSNIDGSRASHVSVFVGAVDRLESFKWHDGSARASLVTAEIDWTLFSVRRFDSWRVQADGQRNLLATLEYRDEYGDYTVSVAPGASVRIENWPWHSYDFDFASLSFCLRHLEDPQAPFTFGIADVVRTPDGVEFADKGTVTMVFERVEERHATACRRYRVDGEGLENRGGTIWVDRDGHHIVDYEIDLPDEPGYESGKLRLERVGHLSQDEWQRFMQERLAR